MSIAAKDGNGAALTLNSTTTAAGEAPGGVPVDPITGAAFKAASEETLAGLLTNTQLRAAPVPVHIDPPQFLRVGFAEVGSGLQGNAASQMTVKQTGGGMAVSQAGGSLVITTGTTTNAETVIRSVSSFSGSLLARAHMLLSQRIANQTFRLEMADVVGEALAFTINSATSVTVSFPAGTSPFTSANVGQSLRLSCISGAAGIPGRFAIASVSGDTVTFTVASWPASGSGTLTLYGWNYIATEYSGTTATNTLFSSQRRGWADAATTATTNATSTKASAGTVWSVVASNINAAARYLKLYNKASAPAVGTDTPVLVIPLPPGEVTQINGGSNGIPFGTGIAWAVTTAAADSDTGAVAAGEIKVCIAYT